jgi:hypothetical protein
MTTQEQLNEARKKGVARLLVLIGNKKRKAK